jgi:hypothetical protein
MLPPDWGNPVEQAVRAQEDAIRHDAVESAYAFDQQGNLILAKTGTEDEVAFTAGELALLKDAVVTHNHPPELALPPDDLTAQGHSFSLDDLQLAARAQVAEIRVVTSTWRYSIKRPVAGWDTHYFRASIEPAFNRHDLEVEREFMQALQHGRMTFAEAADQYFHEVWRRVAAELGLQYRREP